MPETILYRVSLSGDRPDPVIYKIKAKKISGMMFYDLSGKKRFLKGKKCRHFFSFTEAKDFLCVQGEEYVWNKEKELRKAKLLLNKIIQVRETNGQTAHAEF